MLNITSKILINIRKLNIFYDRFRNIRKQTKNSLNYFNKYFLLFLILIIFIKGKLLFFTGSRHKHNVFSWIAYYYQKLSVPRSLILKTTYTFNFKCKYVHLYYSVLIDQRQIFIIFIKNFRGLC